MVLGVPKFLFPTELPLFEKNNDAFINGTALDLLPLLIKSCSMEPAIVATDGFMRYKCQRD